MQLQVVTFKEKENNPCEIDCSFYLAVVKHSSIEDNPDDESVETEIPKVYLKVQTLIEFDTFVVTHGPFTSIDGGFVHSSCAVALAVNCREQRFRPHRIGQFETQRRCKARVGFETCKATCLFHIRIGTCCCHVR